VHDLAAHDRVEHGILRKRSAWNVVAFMWTKNKVDASFMASKENEVMFRTVKL